MSCIAIATLVPAASSEEPQAPLEELFREEAGTAEKSSTVVQTRPQAEAQDLALIAKANGWTIQQAAADRRAADAVGRVAGQVALEMPDAFVGSRVATDPGGIPELYIKGRANERVRALIRAAGGPIRLVENQPFSFQEMEARKLQVHAALEAQGYRTLTTAFSVDGRGKIAAEVTRVPGNAKESPSAVAARLPAAVAGDVEVAVSDDPVVVTEEAFGGMRVSSPSGAVCTSGWSVYNSTGTTGITTAGHCTGITSIDHPGHGTHALAQWAEHRGPYGDVEWKTSSQAEPGNFYASATDIRAVWAIERYFNVSLNENVCLYGRSSNSTACARVSNVSRSCTIDGLTLGRLVETDRDIGIPGDSGGPWFFGNRAYGSHVGNCGAGHEVFSQADWYDEAIGVRVRTDRLLAFESLEAGARLISPDGRFTAWMQNDGNFVVYQDGGVGAIWAASWCGGSLGGASATLTDQLIINSSVGPPTWTTTYPQTQPGCSSNQQTVGGSGLSLAMQSDGNLVMYHPTIGSVWATNTCCR